MAKNERTSKRVAKIAGQILASTRQVEVAIWFDNGLRPEYIKWSDIRALAASALTQTADKRSYKHVATLADTSARLAQIKRKRRARRR